MTFIYGVGVKTDHRAATSSPAALMIQAAVPTVENTPRRDFDPRGA